MGTYLDQMAALAEIEPAAGPVALAA